MCFFFLKKKTNIPEEIEDRQQKWLTNVFIFFFRSECPCNVKKNWKVCSHINYGCSNIYLIRHIILRKHKIMKLGRTLHGRKPTHTLSLCLTLLCGFVPLFLIKLEMVLQLCSQTLTEPQAPLLTTSADTITKFPPLLLYQPFC